MGKPIAGLTGGIASGKSTVARLLAARGVPVVDADAIAREVVEPGSEGLTAVVEAFGEGVLNADGSLDRKALGDIVFRDGEARARLNAITHPRIAETSARRIAELAQTEAPYLIYEAALLIENDLHRAFDALIVVAADRDTQMDRLMRRDGLSETAAKARIDAQLPLEEKVRQADYIIQNDGSLEETRSRTEEVHRALLERFRAWGKT